MKSERFFNCVFSLVFFSSGVFAQSEGADFRIIKNISENRSIAKNNYYTFVSDASLYVDVASPVVIFLVGVAENKDELKKKAVVAVESQVANIALTYLSKHIINRKRPAAAHPGFIELEHPATPSFPSGHTSGAFATATSLSLAFPKWYVIAPSYGWAAMVGYSRMYLGVHYPTDILAGAVLGTGTSYLCYKVNKRIQQKRIAKPVAFLY